ncbi:MAG: Mrp/NBP35 family ATP-binding protein [Bacteroidales bacterium]|nr:Mrp/NBP35 family ATP-binding protein [Bacteroidales bacterium]
MNKLFEKIKLDNVKNIIVVASGKGGVGKSTVASNIAVSLSKKGFKTALVDADIYGPSIPAMFGISEQQPESTTIGDKEIMFPIIKYGVKIMSIGFFIDKKQSLIWRGPMASNAIIQLIENTEWGDLDYMIIDFPPGTGDIQLTSMQKLNLSGAIIVTTPQEIALNDARKAAAMFNNKDLNIPIIGVIENMSWFSPAKHPEEYYYLFGKGGGHRLAAEFDTLLLGQIPLIMEVGEAAEQGKTVFAQDNTTVINNFEKITELMIESNKLKQI